VKRRTLIVLPTLVVVVGLVVFLATRPPRQIVLTGLVTTDTIQVSAEVQGRMQELLVREGDSITNGQLIARIQPQEWKADMAYFASNEDEFAAQVRESEADLRFQEAQTSNQIQQAEATLASAQAQVKQGQADLENAKLVLDRLADLHKQGVEPAQAFDQARTAYDAAKAHVDSLSNQVLAAQSGVALAKANAEQTISRRASLQANVHHLAAAVAQKDKARVRLNYTEIHAPIAGIVDVRAALPGEVINPGQPIVTLINPDDLWVRADIEESYVDRVLLGQKMTVRLPSGASLEGTVFYRSADAGFATQRDVSRSKRDIKTFEIRLRCDNRDRHLAVGMTASVILPLAKP